MDQLDPVQNFLRCSTEGFWLSWELAGVLQSPVDPQPPVWLQVVTGTDRFYFGLVGFMQPEPPPASASTGRASTWLSLAALLVEADRRVALPFQAR